MKRTILTMFAIGLCIGIGSSALAQNVAAGDQPGMNADTTAAPEVNSAGNRDPAMSSDNAKAPKSAALKAEYAAARKKAEADYKGAKAKCGTLGGDAKAGCLKDAQAVHTKTLADAKAKWESHLEMDGRPVKPTKG